MDQSTTSTKETKDTSIDPLYKNKLVIKGITLILTEIIEENIKAEKKKKEQEKKNTGNLRSSLKVPGILI